MTTDPTGRAPVHTRVAWHCTCFNLRRAARAVTRVYDDALAESGLKATQFTMLGAVALTGPATVTRLAESLDLDRTTLTRTLKGLTGRGLLEISAGDDRRERVVSITEAGAAALDAATPAWRAAQKRVVESIGEERWRSLVADMSDLAALASDPPGA